MDDIIRRAIADLSVLSNVASPGDAERIQEIINRMQSLNAHDQHAVRLYQKLTMTFRKPPSPLALSTVSGTPRKSLEKDIHLTPSGL